MARDGIPRRRNRLQVNRPSTGRPAALSKGISTASNGWTKDHANFARPAISQPENRCLPRPNASEQHQARGYGGGTSESHRPPADLVRLRIELPWGSSGLRGIAHHPWEIAGLSLVNLRPSFNRYLPRGGGGGELGDDRPGAARDDLSFPQNPSSRSQDRWSTRLSSWRIDHGRLDDVGFRDGRASTRSDHPSDIRRHTGF
jgi:hypothetical protein